MLTASDVATALGINKFQSIKSLLKQKSTIQLNINIKSAAMEHGNKYEDEARLLFSDRFKIETWEVGLFQHQEYSWLGGSPDGIADDGNLIEIKCPLSRIITHDIPSHYYPQVQICMEILDRPFCYFIQYVPQSLINNGLLDVKIIPRDSAWFLSAYPSLKNFWNKVLFFREHGYSSFDREKIIDLSMLQFEKLSILNSDSDSDSEST